MKTVELKTDFFANNAIRSKVYEEYLQSDYLKSFGQWMKTKEGKETLFNMVERYVYKYDEGLKVENVKVKHDNLIIELLVSDEFNNYDMANNLSYLHNTTVWFQVA